MDDADRAQAESAAYLKACLARAKETTDTGMGSEVCVECGEEIPEERRKAQRGCTLCVECKARLERGNR